MDTLADFKKSFDPMLKKYIEEKIEEFSKNVSDPFILDIIKYPQTLIVSGGKRIRPYIAYLMYEAISKKNKKNILGILVSLEIFHTFCLVHDDIIDKSGIRHGVLTSQNYITAKLAKEKRHGDLEHFGNSQAILMGDLLFSWALKIFDENKNFDNDKLKNAKKYFYKMVDNVFLGQFIDVDIATRGNVSFELINEKNKLKTASYTFIRPLQIGASLAGIDKHIELFCEDLGTELGLAYQMQDDLMDIDQDISENQKTYFTKNSKSQMGKNEIESHLSKAKKIIENSAVEEKYKNKFFQLIETLRIRSN